jgi:hypothetical protein
MLSGRHSRKAIAATLLLIFFNQTFAPSMAYALTSGPTQPEATNFEPIDTTDMVSLQTGDFTYNVPLLEVPGPEGGYPLALSYHAGIQPNVDASWVGLGWSLNPGAIDRDVNGYPDDWYAPSTTSHVYWAGGQTKSYSVGISVGIANIATVGANLTFAHDTYKGFGVGAELDASLLIGGFDNFKLGASIGIGVSPYGDAYMTGGVGLSLGITDNLHASVGISFMTNFKTLSAGFSGGVGYSLGPDKDHQMSGNLLGVSLNTGGGKPSLSLGGLTSSVSNSNANHVSTSSHGFHIDIPVYYGINLSLGYSKVRYWTDETTSVTTWGSLNNLGSGPSSGMGWDNAAYDEYALPESPSFKNIVDYPDPTTVQGGAFPDFDVYNVQCQGLGGTMRPYLFQGRIANQNQYNGSTPLVQYYMPGVTNNAPFFRFENDFANSFRQNEPAYSDPSLNLRFVVPPMDGSPVYGNNDGNAGYNYGSQLAGSRHVDIGPLIHPRHPLGYAKTDRYLDYMIEGFSITNESGVTYHFGLPAYTFNEENYQEKINQTNGATGNRITKPTQYAYTWYLTTITGPDYVDRNGDGIADDGDWGYWVDFEYGKWGNRYNWRNPGQGYNADEDNLWQDVSMGTREVYYLNAIRTRSHVALFEKDIRNDGKGASPESFNKTVVNGIGNAGYSNTGMYNTNSSQSLKLSHIYILNASDENFVTTTSGTSIAYQPAAGTRSVPCSDCELSSNILDKTDVDAVGRPALEAKAIRVIDFNYDYSLCPNTTNSFDINNPGVLTGKLSLLSVLDRGKGGASMIPPQRFAYDIAGAAANTTTGATVSPGSITTTNGTFNIGDMVMASAQPSPVYCGVITAKAQAGGNWVYNLTNGNNTGSSVTATIWATKNPPYNKDAYDGWGMYKSDYSTTAIAANLNLGRMTTPCSSSGVDAWCLRTITTQMGGQVNMNYESDQIGSAALSAPYPFITNSPALDGGQYNKLTFTVNPYGYPLSSVVKVGDVGQLVAMIFYFQCNLETCSDSYLAFQSTYTVTAVDANGTVHVTLSNSIPTSYGGNPYFQTLTGNISGGLTQAYGGGVRTQSVSVTGSDGTTNTTMYNYNDPSTGTSSGVTSYMPGILDIYDKAAIEAKTGGTANEPGYQRVLYGPLNTLYSLSRELPPPGVIYQYVTVTNQIKNPDEGTARTIEGSTLYQFETFNPNMVGIVDVTARTAVNSGGWGMMFSRNLALDKFTCSIGNLKRTIHYDVNGKKLSETINHYLHDNIANAPLASFMSQYKAMLVQYNYQGYLQERYYEVKDVQNQTNSADNGVKATLSAREEYPCIQTGQTVINYVNGTQTSTANLAFDFYSGAVTQTLETDAYGNNFMTQTVPAYRKYAAMGLKIGNDNNKNMLTQVAETYRWKVDGSNNKLGLVSAQATTWTDQFSVIDPSGNSYTQNWILPNGDVWRTQSTYDWLSSAQTTDGTTPVTSFNDFNFTAPGSSDLNWKNTSTVTLYDVYSKPLEQVDINGAYSATHMNYDDRKVSLSGGPANYYEMAFSGAEDANINQTGSPFVKAANGTVTTAAAHTGTQSLQLGVSGQMGFLYSVPTSNLTNQRYYQASVWIKPVSGSTSNVGLYYDIDGGIKGSASSSTSTRMANGWTLVNLLINGGDIIPGHTLNVYCRNDDGAIQVYADDFRFQPLNAFTTAYVYDPFSGELTYVLDNNNTYTNYVYDGAGRLITVNKEKLGTGVFKTASYQYNYATYFCAAINQNYTVSNCVAGDVPSTVNISVPQGTFTSAVSQADADAQAQQYAQSQANAQGTCSVPVTVNVSNNASIVVLFKVGTTTIRSATFGVGTGSMSVPVGTYNIEVIQTNQVSHNVTLSYGYGNSGLDVTFSGVPTQTPLTITVN